jgi:FlaA1/EpsC-like NDP-sugar epimerase
MGKPVKIIDFRNMIRLAGFIPDKEIEIVVGLRPGRN